MKIKWYLPITAVFLVVTLIWWITGQVQGQENNVNDITAVTTNAGSEITYQGTLQDNGSLADGLYNMRFRLYDSLSRGNQVGGDVNLADVPVTKGQFTVDIDFGYGVYNGQALYLEVAIRTESNGFDTLSPRQPLTGVPLAHSVRPGMVVDNSDSNTSAQLAGNSASVTGDGGQYGGYFFGTSAGVYAKGITSDLILSGEGGLFSGRGTLSSDPAMPDSTLNFVSQDDIVL